MIRLFAMGVLFLSMSVSSFAMLTLEQKRADYQQLVSSVERYYAPLRWKVTERVLDWNAHKEKIRAQVEASKSDVEFYRALSQFLAGLQDAHVKIHVPSNYSASLGFQCDYIAGKVLIDTIDTLQLPPVLFPFQRGDQLLAIDGVPAEQLMRGFLSTENTGYEGSAMRVMAARLTERAEAIGYPVPKGVVQVTVLSKLTGVPQTVSMVWKNKGSPALELDDLSQLWSGEFPGAFENTLSTFSDLRSEVKKFRLLNTALPESVVSDWRHVGLDQVGAQKSEFALPEGAKQIDGVDFTAAVYESEGKKIGLVRIPSFLEESIIPNLETVLTALDKETDVLVVDLTNNPGGNVDYVTAISAMFALESYKDVLYRVRPSLNWLQTFRSYSERFTDALEKDPQDFIANALLARFQYLESEVTSAMQERRYLSNPFSLNLTGTFGMIQPETKYFKPVLLLVNELDFSGADAFAAIMKDNHRAMLFGQRTTGAGGSVNEYPPLANSGFHFALTESLMIRPAGGFIENRGIEPDVTYSVTEDDFMNGYKDYVSAFTKSALQLVQPR